MSRLYKQSVFDEHEYDEENGQMTNPELLEEAIAQRRLISFRYERAGKTPGPRVGAPHAAFIRKKKDGTSSSYLHVYQTEGVTDSGQVLPSWRQFFINDVRDIRLLHDLPTFETAEGYNPSSYEFPIAKV